MPSGTLNARLGKWTVNAAASGNFTPKNESMMTSVRQYPDNDNRFSSLQVRHTIGLWYGTHRTIFEIDTVNSIGAEIEYVGQLSKGNSYSETELTKQEWLINSTGDYNQKNDYNTLSATANYLHKLDDKGSLLKWIVDYAGKKSTGKNNYYVVQKAAGREIDSTYRSNSDATYKIVTTDIPMNKYFRKGMSLNTGLKYTHTFMDDNSCYEGLSADQQWSISPAYGYALKYKGKHHGNICIFFSTEINRWTFIAGLRGRISRTANESDRIKRDYFDLFPEPKAPPMPSTT